MKSQNFIAELPLYAPTPLVRLDWLAQHLGLADFFVKDESYRFGLNAFKVLGGSYAIARWLCDRLSLPMDSSPGFASTAGDSKSPS